MTSVRGKHFRNICLTLRYINVLSRYCHPLTLQRSTAHCASLTVVPLALAPNNKCALSYIFMQFCISICGTFFNNVQCQLLTPITDNSNKTLRLRKYCVALSLMPTTSQLIRCTYPFILAALQVASFQRHCVIGCRTFFMSQWWRQQEAGGAIELSVHSVLFVCKH